MLSVCKTSSSVIVRYNIRLSLMIYLRVIGIIFTGAVVVVLTVVRIAVVVVLVVLNVVPMVVPGRRRPHRGPGRRPHCCRRVYN